MHHHVNYYCSHLAGALALGSRDVIYDRRVHSRPARRGDRHLLAPYHSWRESA